MLLPFQPTDVCIVLRLQSSLLHSQPKSTVGTPAYIAPEVLSKKEYDGKVSKKIFDLVAFPPENGRELDLWLGYRSERELIKVML